MAPSFTPAFPRNGHSAAIAIALPAERYGQRSGLNMPAAILTVLLHVALVSAFFMIRNHVVQKQEDKLTVVNLTPAPPPPPPQSTPQPPQTVRTPIVAPKPLVQMPAPISPVLATPDPVPMPPMPSVPASPAPPAPPAPPSIIQANDLGARMVAGKPPHYPTDSRRKHEQGTVVLSLTLGYDGRVADISVNHSSGFARLDSAALDAVRKWRWEPILRGGQPVMVRGLVEIPFVLKD